MRIAGNARANLRATWLFTVLWNTVSVPILYYIPPELHRNPVAAIGFVFPVAGAGLLVWAVLATLRVRRFGDAWLEVTSAPAAPGGTWTAAVHARLPQPADAGGYAVTVRLTCLQRTISRSSDDRSERERIVWREEVEVPASSVAFWPEGASIPVRFDLPADALETTAVGKGEGVLWVLTAEAALPGVNLKEDFDVQVRRDAAEPRTLTPRTHAAPAGVSVDDLARAGISVAPSPGGTTFRFGAMRNVAFAVGVTAFTAIWTGALWLQWFLGFPWIFPLLTGLVDLLLIYIVLDVWCGTTTVTAGSGDVRVHHSVLGLGGTRVIAAAEIASLDLHIGMQTQGRYGTPYYEVRARLTSGRKASLGGGIRNKRHAEWLAAQMRASIGIK